MADGDAWPRTVRISLDAGPQVLGRPDEVEVLARALDTVSSGADPSIGRRLEIVQDRPTPQAEPRLLLLIDGEVVARPTDVADLVAHVRGLLDALSPAPAPRLRGVFLRVDAPPHPTRVTGGGIVVLEPALRGFVLDHPAPWARAGLHLDPVSVADWDPTGGEVEIAGTRTPLVALLTAGELPPGALGAIDGAARFLDAPPQPVHLRVIGALRGSDAPRLVPIGRSIDPVSPLRPLLDVSSV